MTEVEHSRYAFGDCVLDSARLELWREGRRVPVEPQVFDVLAYLLAHRDRVVSKEELLERIWGSQFVTEAALTSRIKSARRAVGDDGAAQGVIRTARGRGFRFVAEVAEVSATTATRQSTAPSGAPPAGPPNPGPHEGLRAPPAPATTMLGRAAELAGARDALRRSRLVTVLGPGGVGKTTLAIAVAATEASRFSHGACWCDWSAIADGTIAAGVLADALGATVVPPLTTEDSLVHAIGDRDLLLVADNCEHIVAEAAELLHALVTACPRLRVLATSRSPLAVPSEALFPLSPLSCEEGSAGGPEGSEPAPDGVAAGWSAAAALFVARARNAAPALELDDDPDGVEQVCRAVDGLPLAIELTAARLRRASLAEVRDHLTGVLHLQDPPMRGRVPRHETLRATIEWSHRLLEPAARRLLEQVWVFPAGFTADDVRDLRRHLATDRPADMDELDELDQLVEQSLVVADRTGRRTRYRLLETIRSFARARLGDEQGHALRRHHAAWTLEVAERAARTIHGPDEAAAVARFGEIFADLRAAHRWAAEQADVDTALRLTLATHHYALHRLRDEAFSWAEVACGLPGAGEHPAAPAATGSLAQGLANRGDLDRARRLATGALDRCGEHDRLALWPLHALCNIALYHGRLDDAVAYAESEMAIALAVGDDAHASYAAITPVLAHAYRGEVAAALPWAERQDEHARRSGNPTLIAWARFAGGELLAPSDPAAAERLLTEAIETGAAVHSDFVVGAALVTLASTYVRLDRQRDALEALRRAIRLWRQRGDWTHLWTTLRNLVEVLHRSGRAEEAAWLLGASTGPGRGAPTFGDAKARLDAARGLLTDALGADAVASLLARGRRTAAEEVVDRADALVGELLGR